MDNRDYPWVAAPKAFSDSLIQACRFGVWQFVDQL
jgi:hypothetical protein